MFKSLFLVATLVSSSAFADSNVTVYGQASASMESAKSVQHETRVVSNDSFLGFKGAEDLGNGLKAVFQIETAVNMNGQPMANGESFAMRNTKVGLQSAQYGEVFIGKWDTPFRIAGAQFDINGFKNNGSNLGLMGNTPFSASVVAPSAFDSFNARASNVLGYNSPVIGGFQVSAVASPSQSNGNLIYGSMYSAGGTYTNGPLVVGLAYIKSEVNNSILGRFDFSENKGVRLGAAYVYPNQYGNFKVTGLVEQLRQVDHVGLIDYKRNAGSLGVSQSFGKNTVYASYTKALDGSDSKGNNVSNTGASQYTVGHVYDLSKRTSVNTYFTNIDNKEQGMYGLAMNGMDFNAVGQNVRTLGTGLTVKF